MESKHLSPFAPLLRRLRREVGLTQEGLAERAGVAWRTVSDLERGVKLPRRDTVALLAGALALTGEPRVTFEAAARRPPEPSGVAPARTAFGPASPRSLALSLSLVGRTQELALLNRHLAGEGPPVFLLAGQPGIGKSRLLGEAAVNADSVGWRVLAGGCARGAEQQPFAPLLQALQRHLSGQSPADRLRDLRGCAWLVRLLPELAGGDIEPLPRWTLPPTQERRLMFEAVRRFLANVAGPAGTLLLLDDLQWAGPDALALLSSLLEKTDQPPTRVVGAYRDTEVGPEHPLGAVIAELAERQLASRYPLRP
ncbi:MAG: AAA family ATPase, partial [Chloroflexota bacterium]